MGVDYAACTVVGVEIDKAALYSKKKTRHRGCEHPLPDGSDDPFCSQCGRKAWIESTVSEPLPFYDEDSDTFSGLDVVYDQCYDEDKTQFFVGTATTMDMQCGIPAMMSPSVVEETKRQLQAVLEPLGLWDEDKFGIWTFVQYS